MNKFSSNSLAKLEQCDPILQILFNEVIEVIDCTILCGHRGQEEQDKMFEEGKSRCIWPNSNHNSVPSIAVDAAPYYKGIPHIRWDKKSLYRWYFFGGIVCAIAHELDFSIRWGGDWDGDTYVTDQTFNDLPHFEIVYN